MISYPLLKIMLFDCHWHPLEHEENKLEERISEAKEMGVEEFVGVPLEADSCGDLIEISKEFENLYPSVGIHPHSALKSDEKSIAKVSETMNRPEVVAVGEIGVDLHFLEKDTKRKQLSVFKKLLKEAKERNLPVILHCPRGEPLTFEEVRGAGVGRAVFHWYTGPHETLRKILDIDGYYISVTPAVVYSGKLQRVVELAGLDNILLESDGPTKFRKVGNGKPSHVRRIAEKISGIKSVDFETVEEITSRNAREFFRL